MNSQLKTQRILIVDDDVSVRRFLSRGLGFEGYRTLEAENGAVALTLTATETPDLVILDLMLPDMDGFEVLERLRDSGLEAPVILLSGNDEPETRAAVKGSGASDYMVKPVEFDLLLDCIARHLKSAYTLA